MFMNHEHLIFLNRWINIVHVNAGFAAWLAFGRQCKILVNGCGAGIVGPGLAFF